MIASCSASEVRSQVSTIIRILRLTRYDPPVIQSGPSPGCTHRWSRSSSVSSSLRLAVPSLKPNRLRGVACVFDVDDVRPKPSCDQRTLTTPMPIRARLRIACTATCGSLAQACTHRSPPEMVGSSRSPGKCGRSASAGGRLSAMPKRSLPVASRNSVGPKPTVMVSPEGGSPSASPVSSGGASGMPPTAPISPASCPAVILAAAAVQSFSRLTSRSRSLVTTSNATKCNRSWAGVTMPAWCSPVNGTAPATACDSSANASLTTAPPTAAAPATPATPTPASAMARRRDTLLSDIARSLLLRDDGGNLADGLRERVDRVGETLQVGLAEGVVQLPAVAVAVLAQRAFHVRELGVERLDQRGVALLEHRAQRRDGRLGALEVGVEVPQVGVRVAVLLAGDLAGGDLVEQFLGAVGELQRGELLGIRPGDDLLDVGQQPVRDRAVLAHVRLGGPEVLL